MATLDRARDAVRQFRAEQVLGRPVTVTLGGGVYRREEPVVLEPEEANRRQPRGTAPVGRRWPKENLARLLAGS